MSGASLGSTVFPDVAGRSPVDHAGTVFLIRHGEIPANYAGRYLGCRCDPPLSEEGRESCRALSELPVDRVYSSPLLRARETAAFLPVKFTVENRLREIDFGQWENLTFEQILRRAPEEAIRIWKEERDAMVFPGGESVAEFHFRVTAFFRELNEEDGNTAVVTHGGVIMYLRRILAGASAQKEQTFLIPRGSFVKFAFAELKKL
ncbi:MAG: histidine phosphatase family protein [Victivallaceae bacterium]|nr:histidine phosphatase family protein [Victivallaceae bacterium]